VNDCRWCYSAYQLVYLVIVREIGPSHFGGRRKRFRFLSIGWGVQVGSDDSMPFLRQPFHDL
jgi:hypothetical protein